MITSALAEGNTEIILCCVLLSVKSLFEKAITPGMSSISCKKKGNKIRFIFIKVKEAGFYGMQLTLQLYSHCCLLEYWNQAPKLPFNEI